MILGRFTEIVEVIFKQNVHYGEKCIQVECTLVVITATAGKVFYILVIAALSEDSKLITKGNIIIVIGYLSAAVNM